MTGRIIRRSSAILIAVMMVSAILLNTVSAATIVTLQVTYTAKQSDARGMLSSINSWRTGGDAWYWNSDNSEKVKTGKLAALNYDYALEQIAIQRAVEIAVSFSHTRPDGSRCFTCTYNDKRSWGENIAWGYSSASAVFEAWKEENDKYSGQGHRRNMLGAEGYDFKYIGIAHVVVNGSHCWVQEFSYYDGGMSETTAESGTKTRSVDVDTSIVSLSLQVTSSVSSINVPAATTASLPSITASYTKSGIGSAVLDPSKYSVTWTSSNSSVISISGSKYTAKATGSATLTATAVIDGKSYTVNVPVTVTGIPISSSSVTAALPSSSYTFTGSQIKPVPTVKNGDVTLVEGTDYTLSYQNNKNAGEGTVTITGKGGYDGSRTLKFTIAQKNIASSFSIRMTVQEYTYTGSAISPDVTVTDGKTTLNKTTDYTLKITNNVNAGTGSVTVTGQGNYTGSVTSSFTIKPVSSSKLKVAAVGDQTFTGSAITPALNITFNGTKLVKNTDYTVKFENNTNVGTASFTVTFKKNYSGTYKGSFNIVSFINEPGWQKVGDTYVYVQDDLTLKKSSWLNENNKWYYFDNNGRMVKGIYKVGADTYIFDDSGVMLTGWKEISGKWYYLSSSGVMQKGWIKVSKVWYYFDESSGVMATGLFKISGVLYYFKDSGALGTGWYKNTDGSYYYFTTNGVVTGWKQISKVWYYFDGSGIMATGVKKIDGEIYVFASSGAMQKSGWKQSGSDWYYLTKSGTAYVKKWLKSGGKWYWFDSSGKMVKSKTVTIDGVKYTFDKDGVLV